MADDSGDDTARRRIGVAGMTYHHNRELRAEVKTSQANAALARLNYQEARSTIQSMLGLLQDRRLAGAHGGSNSVGVNRY